MELNYLLLLPLTVVIVWVVVFVLNERYRVLHDRLFFACAVCSALTYCILMHSLVEGTANYYFLVFDNLETLLGLSICPLLFLYVRSVSRDEKWHWWYVWFFVPAVMVAIAGTALSFAVGWDRILEIRLDGYHPFTPECGNVLEKLYYVVNIQLFDITVEIMAVIMIAQCIFLLIRYSRKAELYYANIEDASIDKMRRFLASSILNLAILFLLTYFILNIVGNETCYLVVISLSISFLLWVMAKNAYGIVVAKDSLELIDTLSVADNGDPQLVANEQISEKLHLWLSSEEKHYCREGITLVDVARDLHTNPRQLSAFINKNKEMNFRRWINALRIEEAKRLITANPDEKLTYIAALCGFADLAAFSKAFRMIEDCSPLEYKGQLKKRMR